jgi:hypothetical protein
MVLREVLAMQKAKLASLRSKNKRRRKKSLPSALVQPINYDPDLVHAGAFPDAADEEKKAAVSKLFADLSKKFDALFEYYKIDKTKFDSSFQLILAMAMKLFPQGFRFIHSDTKVKGNKRRRGVAEIVDLWVIMKSLTDNNTTTKQAAQYVHDKRLVFGSENDVVSIVARYDEAKAFIKRLEKGDITQWESYEFQAWLAGRPIRR